MTGDGKGMGRGGDGKVIGKGMGWGRGWGSEGGGDKNHFIGKKGHKFIRLNHIEK